MSEPTIQMLPVASLIEDLALYPRHVIDDVHVSNMVSALRAGTQFPPVVADKHSLRLIDGWHRVRAYRRQIGDQAVIEVEVRDYGGDEDALFLAAVAANAGHGRKLDRIDQQRCLVLAEQREIPLPAIARVLHLPMERVERMRVHVAYADQPGEPATVTGSNKVVLKRPLHHLDGRQLTLSQLIAIESAPGTSYLLLCNQLVDGLREGLVNLSDMGLVQRLWHLHDVMEHTLPEREAA